MSAAKRKGTAAESAVVAYLRSLHWPHAERRVLNGSQDKGDVNLSNGCPVVIEVKNHRTLDLAEWVDEADQEAAVASAEFGVVWHKRRGKGSPADWYVTMTGATFAELLRGWEREGP